MTENIHRLKNWIKIVVTYINSKSEAELAFKASQEKWSKKEILGHLIDSGMYNLRRFIEIQFEAKPYRICSYKQDDMVKANNYQHAETVEIIEMWRIINERIVVVMDMQTERTLQYTIIAEDDSLYDLRFLITDYVDHLEHHVLQIIGE